MLLLSFLVFVTLDVYYEHSQAEHIETSDRVRTIKMIDNGYERPIEELCEPFKPITLNFSASSRISQKKCFEYITLVENHIREEIWKKRCDHNTQMKGKKIIERVPIIYGGQEAIIEDFPHMGAIGWKAKTSYSEWVFKCGSTLISEKFSLTAAHCSKLSLKSVSDVIQGQPEIVRLGFADVTEAEIRVKGKVNDIKIKRIIPHPKYVSPKKYYDIALIELNEEVKFTKSLHPACLWPNHDFSELGNEVMLTGWGKTEHGHVSEILQVATVDVLETPLCERLLRPFRNRNWQGFQNHQICAGKLAGGVDTCQGDSGGPIQVEMPLEHMGSMNWVLGITSFGIKCGQMNLPGIYTRVSSFIGWIEEIVWEPHN